MKLLIVQILTVLLALGGYISAQASHARIDELEKKLKEKP